MNKKTKHFLEKKSTKRFLKASRRFIRICEEKDIKLKKFLPELHEALLAIYRTAYNLKRLNFHFKKKKKGELKKTMADLFLQYRKYSGLIGKLGKGECYWEVFDPTYSETDGVPEKPWAALDKHAIMGSLKDDIYSIYSELKELQIAIEKIQTDFAIETYFSYVKSSYDFHWGRHCISSLRCLHYLKYKGRKNLDR